MIEVSGLVKTLGGHKAVDDVSFCVNEGDHLAILGTSGSGKTTTLKLINRLLEPEQGTVKVNGTNVTSIQPEELRRTIGYVLQHNSLFPHYTVAENIAVVPRLLKWDKKKIEARTNELLLQLQLDGKRHLNSYPKELSGGQQQRVNIARALAADPPILLMDEPFGALDNITRATIRRELKGLDTFRRKTVVMVTHDVAEAFEMADIICVMNKGKIMQIGSKQQLLFHPENTFIEDFFAEQYTQLSMQLVSISDIWNYLPDAKDEMLHRDINTKDIHIDIWTLISQLTSEKNNKDYRIKVQKSGEEKIAGLDDILNAFSCYKSQ